MALLRIQVASKEFIEFTPINLNFIREEDVSVNSSIPYTNGSGQVITDSETLYQTGTEGVVGFIRVKANGTTTLGSSGNLPITIEHYPSATQAANALSFTYDGSTIIINLTYNSRPVAEDVIIPLANRDVKTFSAADFDYSDYDSDLVTEIALFGAVDGYEFNGALYISGTWIPVGDLHLLTYVALDQDGAYNKDVTWKVKDVNGNISVQIGLLRIEVAGLVCAPPNLITAINEPLNSYEDFELSWDYSGIDYSSDETTSIAIQYSLDDGVTWNNYTGGIFEFTDTSASITIPSITWEYIHFRLHLLNRDCSEYSNVIITEYVAA